MPLPLLALAPVAPIPVAAAPVPAMAEAPDAVLPYTPPTASLLDDGGIGGSVETFDPTARAELIAARIPRSWRGNYRPFERGATPRPVLLQLDSVVPDGQMVVLRGRLQIAGAESPFMANLNAKSDQLDLIPLSETLALGIEPGGAFQGLQGLSLSGWGAPRFVAPGGRLQLVPGPPPAPASAPAASSGGVIRGLW